MQGMLLVPQILSYVVLVVLVVYFGRIAVRFGGLMLLGCRRIDRQDQFVPPDGADDDQIRSANWEWLRQRFLRVVRGLGPDDWMIVFVNLLCVEIYDDPEVAKELTRWLGRGQGRLLIIGSKDGMGDARTFNVHAVRCLVRDHAGEKPRRFRFAKVQTVPRVHTRCVLVGGRKHRLRLLLKEREHAWGEAASLLDWGPFYPDEIQEARRGVLEALGGAEEVVPHMASDESDLTVTTVAASDLSDELSEVLAA